LGGGIEPPSESAQRREALLLQRLVTDR